MTVLVECLSCICDCWLAVMLLGVMSIWLSAISLTKAGSVAQAIPTTDGLTSYAGTTTTRHQLTCGEDPPHVVIREWCYDPQWLRIDDEDVGCWGCLYYCIDCVLKLYAGVKERMEAMQQHNMSWIEVQFLKKAVDVLCQCRQTLMYTYVFAFYLQRNNQSIIFEVK